MSPLANSLNPSKKEPILPLCESEELRTYDQTFNLRFISFSLASSVLVSTMNTTDKFFARIKSPSSFSVTRFPSPGQFHTKKLMALGRAAQQPPPLDCLSSELLERHACVCVKIPKSPHHWYFVSSSSLAQVGPLLH